MLEALSKFRPAGYRHVYLLVSLLLALIATPFLDSEHSTARWFESLLFVTLIAGVFDAVRSKRSLIAVSVLAVAAVGTRLVWDGTEDSPWLVAFLFSYLAFYSAVTLALVLQLARKRTGINFQTLCGALSAYILLGFIWAIAYALLELQVPGSFAFNIASAETTTKFDRFLGFSFTTLTTLGYGNVAPANPRADALTTAEAITGQIYIAVVIARLVALEILQHSKTD